MQINEFNELQEEVIQYSLQDVQPYISQGRAIPVIDTGEGTPETRNHTLIKVHSSDAEMRGNAIEMKDKFVDNSTGLGADLVGTILVKELENPSYDMTPEYTPSN